MTTSLFFSSAPRGTRRWNRFSFKQFSKSKPQMVKNLETIADDCAEDDISLVRIDDKEEAGQYGLKKLPALLFFNFQVPKLSNRLDSVEN